jgi:hypothetical protein
MRYILIVGGAVLAGAVVATASHFEWTDYDPNKSVKLSGIVRTAENIDGFVVIRIKTDSEHQPSTTWVVVLGTPKELKDAGLPLELTLGIPVEAIVWERKPGGNREARAQQISLNHSQTAILHPD